MIFVSFNRGFLKFSGMLNHKFIAGIVRIYDSGDDQGRPYYVMESLEGRPLDGVIEASEADIAVTKQLAAAGKIIGIHLIDHIIIAKDSFKSITIDYS